MTQKLESSRILFGWKIDNVTFYQDIHIQRQLKLRNFYSEISISIRQNILAHLIAVDNMTFCPWIKILKTKTAHGTVDTRCYHVSQAQVAVPEEQTLIDQVLKFKLTHCTF